MCVISLEWITEGKKNGEERMYEAQKKTHTYESGRCTQCNGIDPDFRPVITEGAGGVWKKGSKDTLSFRSDAGYADFLKVQVDGNDVAVTDYEVSEGSTIVTLKASYLESLSVGIHTLSAISQTGTAETTFAIQEGEGGSSGQEQETPSDPSENIPQGGAALRLQRQRTKPPRQRAGLP